MIRTNISREELERDVNEYREARVARLTAERGWLTLVGKVWLREGRHSLGADPASDIVLPRGSAPDRLGTLTLASGKVHLEITANEAVFARGQPIRSLDLRSDADASPDEITMGTLSFQLLQRGAEFAFRIRDKESAARRTFPGIPAFPIDPAWRIVARLEAFASPKEMSIEDGDGRPQTYLCPGVANFEKDGQPATLLPLYEKRDDRLFLLFSDWTNKEDSYGAGRFLYAPWPDDGQVLLDFNKAFNPPCAFTPYAVCPLPPPENKLPMRVDAGEKRPPSYG